MNTTILHTIGREEEKNILVSTLLKQRPAAVIGPMYRGKTHLAMYVMDELFEKKVTPVYFNCLNGFTEQMFLEQYSKQILKSMSVKIKNIFEDSQKYLPNIKPKVNLNTLHGVDIKVDYYVSGKDIQQYLCEVIEVPNKIYKDTHENMVIILDEVQALMDLRTVNIPQMIKRSLQPGVTYLFLSSKKNDFEQKIIGKDDPFIENDAKLFIKKIPVNVLYFYLENMFKDHDIKVTTNIIDKIIHSAEGEIAFITILLAKLIEKGKMFKRVSIVDISNAIKEILNNREDVYYQFFESLSGHQKSLVIALAKHSGKQIFKSDFIYENGLVSVPSVQTSIKALIRKDMVYKENGEYVITNVYFKEWLKRNFL